MIGVVSYIHFAAVAAKVPVAVGKTGHTTSQTSSFDAARCANLCARTGLITATAIGEVPSQVHLAAVPAQVRVAVLKAGLTLPFAAPLQARATHHAIRGTRVGTGATVAPIKVEIYTAPATKGLAGRTILGCTRRRRSSNPGSLALSLFTGIGGCIRSAGASRVLPGLGARVQTRRSRGCAPRGPRFGGRLVGMQRAGGQDKGCAHGKGESKGEMHGRIRAMRAQDCQILGQNEGQHRAHNADAHTEATVDRATRSWPAAPRLR